MLPDTTTLEEKYNLFIKNVAASKLVWALKNKNGWANTNASDDEDTDLIPFWSDRTYAKICARDEWRDYSPVSIRLPEFLENWCMEMAEGDVLAGINWDSNMLGTEADALVVATDILNQLAEMNSAISFRDHASINDLIAKLKELTD